jgi:eukaryotic-like serine/threonine-protein kinase
MEQPNQTSTRFGVFELDTRSGELRKSGTRIRIQDQPLKVLMALLETPGTVVTREELKRRIWPDESFGDFDHAVNVAVAKLRAALADSADAPRFIETLHRRGYRFIFPVTPQTQIPPAAIAMPTNGVGAKPAPEPVEKHSRFSRAWVAAIVLAILGVAAVGWAVLPHKKPKLTDKDTIVLADFTNTTGDAVFDGTLRQGLTVQLGQSPFLSLLSEERVRQTLQLMSRPPDTRLTPDVARELCQRTGSTAVLDGSIAKLGNQYVLGLKAVNCTNGDSLAEEQVTADGKEQVLKALAEAAAKLRGKLGESLMTVEKFNTPVEQVTTPSLEALQAYSLGRTTLIDEEDYAGAIPLFERAVSLDPNFAMAYASLGLSYNKRSEQQSVWYFRKAYELRERVSDRERFYIEAHYHEAVTGNWEKARQVYELWAQTYPRDDIAHLNVGEIYSNLGDYEDARRESAESLRLLPGDCLSYGHLLTANIHLGHLDEARKMADSAERSDCFHFQFYRYELAFLQHDAAAMAQAVNASTGKWGAGLLEAEAQTAAYYGRLKQSREFMRRVNTATVQTELQELAGIYEGWAAENEALFGYPEEAKKDAAAALARSKGRDVEGVGALALALAGEERQVKALVDDLGMRYPEDTLVQFSYLPTARAQMALNRKDSSKALQALQAASPYELGAGGESGAFYAIFLRGQAYLMAHKGSDAAAEFQKILDHPGIVLNEPIGALAHLGIARAYVLVGDPTKAKSAYQDFLTLWKDADADLPILKQAKAEYAKLQSGTPSQQVLKNGEIAYD